MTGGIVPRKLLLAPACEDSRCLNPDCLTVTTRNQHAKGPRTLLDRMAIAATQRATMGKIDMLKANEIRRSTASLTETARAHGVTPSLALKIRKNLVWVDYSNPYLQLAA